MVVLYGSYDKTLESKVLEIIDSEAQENITEPGRLKSRKILSWNQGGDSFWYDVDFGALGIIRVRKI